MQRLIHDGHVIVTHSARAGWMEHRATHGAGEIKQLIVSFDLGPRQVFRLDELQQMRVSEERWQSRNPETIVRRSSSADR